MNKKQQARKMKQRQANQLKTKPAGVKTAGDNPKKFNNTEIFDSSKITPIMLKKLHNQMYREKKMKENGQQLHPDSLPGKRAISTGKIIKSVRVGLRENKKLDRQDNIFFNDFNDFFCPEDYPEDGDFSTFSTEYLNYQHELIRGVTNE